MIDDHRTSESHLRVAPANRLASPTDGRTDVQNEEPTHRNHQTNGSNAGTRVGEFGIQTIGEVLWSGINLSTERYPVVRIGERDPIPAHVRAGVFCPIHTRKPEWCRVYRGYQRAFDATGEIPTWHQRDPLELFHLTAYCAHCNMPGQTGVVL